MGTTLMVLMLSPGLAIPTAQAQVQAQSGLAERLEKLAAMPIPRIGPHKIASVKFLIRLYAFRQNRPMWEDAENRQALKSAVGTSWVDGLMPRDFHASALGINFRNVRTDGLDDTDYDLLQSDALARLLYQHFYGKVSPHKLDANWNFERQLPSGDAAQLISEAADAGRVGDLIERAKPDHPIYRALRRSLATYKDFQLKGGWPTIPAGPVLKPGMADPRLPVIRQRLAVSGHYRDAAGASAGDRFDETLVEAVKRFQADHGLARDGVIGPQTLATLNVSAGSRVDQIRVNMERARWVIRTLSARKDLVLVNIAGFYLRLILDGKPVWKTDVITGRPYHKTPVFTESMRYLVINPDWVVPRSIIRNEILPKAIADPSYLGRGNYQLIDANGRAVPAQQIDWSTQNRRSFRYRVVQNPGAGNALGRVKFIFPNRFNVYLHDTPSRQLFSKSGRAFSHGCIRVKDPLKLAELLLGARNGLARGQVDAIQASGKMTRINLKQPIQVAILYWTVDANDDGTTRFYGDVYKRDQRLLAALNAAFKPEISAASR